MGDYVVTNDPATVTREIVDIAIYAASMEKSEPSDKLTADDWEAVWYRMESSHLDDGRGITLPEDLTAASLAKIKKLVRVARKAEAAEAVEEHWGS